MIGRIAVDALMVDCIIGCLETERTAPQTVRVDLWVELDIQSAADRDHLTATWDYCAISQQLMFILQRGQFYLLESAGRMLLRHLLLPPAADESRPAALAASVSLTKFGALPGQATPCLTLTSQADALTWLTERHAWGQRQVIDTSRRLRLSRLSPATGVELPAPAGQQHQAIAGSHSVLCIELLRG